MSVTATEPTTSTDPGTEAGADPAAPPAAPAAPADLVERDLLVEDVSIDGMCGVY